VRYFPIATAGIGLHDVTPAPDGSVWFTGQRNGTMGRLNPADGSYKLVNLGSGAAPHGVVIGPDGAPWITEGGQNAIARVDPGNHAVKLYKMPGDRGYTNLNTGVFDKQGIYWFTGQPERHLRPARHQVGRDESVRCAARPRALRHHRHPERRCLVRLARRQLYRQDRPEDRCCHRCGTADQGPGRTPGLVGFQRPDLGERME
jgi:hypothetical protein